MSCNSKGAAATFCLFIEKTTGEKITQQDWHDLTKLAGKEGFETGRRRLDAEDAERLLRGLYVKVSAEGPDQSKGRLEEISLAKSYAEGQFVADTTISTLSGQVGVKGYTRNTKAVIQLLSRDGIKASLNRVRADRKSANSSDNGGSAKEALTPVSRNFVAKAAPVGSRWSMEANYSQSVVRGNVGDTVIPAREVTETRTVMSVNGDRIVWGREDGSSITTGLSLSDGTELFTDQSGALVVKYNNGTTVAFRKQGSKAQPKTFAETVGAADEEINEIRVSLSPEDDSKVAQAVVSSLWDARRFAESDGLDSRREAERHLAAAKRGAKGLILSNYEAEEKIKALIASIEDGLK